MGHGLYFTISSSRQFDECDECTEHQEYTTDYADTEHDGGVGFPFILSGYQLDHLGVHWVSSTARQNAMTAAGLKTSAAFTSGPSVSRSTSNPLDIRRSITAVSPVFMQ